MTEQAWEEPPMRLFGREPFIDWATVDERWNYLARDEDGWPRLFTEKPEASRKSWMCTGHGVSVNVSGLFSSYHPGTCDWRDSLVERPKERTRIGKSGPMNANRLPRTMSRRRLNGFIYASCAVVLLVLGSLYVVALKVNGF